MERQQSCVRREELGYRVTRNGEPSERKAASYFDWCGNTNGNLQRAQRLMQASNAHEVVEFARESYTLANTFLISYGYQGDCVRAMEINSTWSFSSEADAEESKHLGFSCYEAPLADGFFLTRTS